MPRIEFASEPKAILLARVAVAKLIPKGNVSLVTKLGHLFFLNNSASLVARISDSRTSKNV